MFDSGDGFADNTPKDHYFLKPLKYYYHQTAYITNMPAITGFAGFRPSRNGDTG